MIEHFPKWNRKLLTYCLRDEHFEPSQTGVEPMHVCMVCVAVQLFDTHLGNGTGRSTATVVAPLLLLTSGPARYGAVLQGCGTSPMRGVVLTCDSAHSWQLYYSTASLQHQATGTMSCYPTQSHYSDTEPTGPLPYPNNSERLAMEWQILILKSLVRFSRVRTSRRRTQTHKVRIPRSSSTGGGPTTHSATPSGQHEDSLLLSGSGVVQFSVYQCVCEICTFLHTLEWCYLSCCRVHPN